MVGDQLVAEAVKIVNTYREEMGLDGGLWDQVWGETKAFFMSFFADYTTENIFAGVDLTDAQAVLAVLMDHSEEWHNIGTQINLADANWTRSISTYNQVSGSTERLTKDVEDLSMTLDGLNTKIQEEFSAFSGELLTYNLNDFTGSFEEQSQELRNINKLIDGYNARLKLLSDDGIGQIEHLGLSFLKLGHVQQQAHLDAIQLSVGMGLIEAATKRVDDANAALDTRFESLRQSYINMGGVAAENADRLTDEYIQSIRTFYEEAIAAGESFEEAHRRSAWSAEIGAIMWEIIEAQEEMI
jgi:hypothetical protein